MMELLAAIGATAVIVVLAYIAFYIVWTNR